MRASHFPRSFVIGAIVIMGLVIGSILLLLPLDKDGAVTISRSQQTNNSSRVVFEVRNHMNKSIRLYQLELLARFGTNWGFVSHVPLGTTNTSAPAFYLEAHPPSGGRDWKVKLVFMLEVTGIKLFGWRLKHAWESRSLQEGFGLTGWEGEHHAYSEELHQ